MYLEKTVVKGGVYYCAVEKKRVNGKVMRTFQQYLGTAEHIANCLAESKGSSFCCLKSYQFGKTAAFLMVAEELGFVESVNRHVKEKRGGFLSVGEYLLLNVIGRCDGSLSENSLRDWFKKSSLSLLWKVNHDLSAQNFLNQYKRLSSEDLGEVEEDLCSVLAGKGLAPEVLFLDESNWFTYIEKGEKLPLKGKNKKHRGDKNQVSAGLVVSGESIPFIHEVYEGNKHDSKVFPELLEKLTKRLTDLKLSTEHLVLVFDKGNNSEKNIAEALSRMHIVASAKHCEARDLLDVPLEKYEHLYTNRKEHKVFGYRTQHVFFGKEFVTVVSYNTGAYERQKKKYEENLKKIHEKLKDLQERLKSPKARKRSSSSMEREINEIIRKEYRSLIEYQIKGNNLTYSVKKEVEEQKKKGFGKTLIFTDLSDWNTQKIVETYNKKYLIEESFKTLNNTFQIPIGPINHRKDHNIKTHIALCMFGLLFHRYLHWKCRELKISQKELLKQLENIRIAIVQDKKTKKYQTLIEKINPIQTELITKLNLGKYIKT